MIIQGREFTIGSDTEVFVKNNKGFVSAHNLIPGTKKNPHPVSKGAVQVDGMATEYNIDPASSYEEFQNNLDVVQQQLLAMIGDHSFMEDVSVNYDADFEQTIPASALRIGCESDFNGWMETDNPSPNDKVRMRTVGGHIHVGGFSTNDVWDYYHFSDAARMARILDETVGVYSLLWDKDDQRRMLYGKAGCFRPKPYGMEYRTLSSKWSFKPQLTKFVYDGVCEAIDKWLDPKYEPSDEIEYIINESDRNNPLFDNNEKADYLRSIA